MMTAQEFAKLKLLNVVSFDNMSIEQQIELCNFLAQQINANRKKQSVNSGANFNIGDIVKFHSKKHRCNICIKIEKFNRAHTCVVGYEVDSKGERKTMAIRWTVENSLCTLVN